VWRKGKKKLLVFNYWLLVFFTGIFFRMCRKIELYRNKYRVTFAFRNSVKLKKMNVLVVAATILEISPFLEQYRSGKSIAGNIDIDVLITGIGLTATTYSLTKQLSIKRPDLIIQAGVGGCFDNSIPPGTVLAVKQEAIADQSVIELDKLKTMFDLKLLPENQFPFTKGWLVNKSEVLKKVKLKKVTGVSVNEITTAKQKVKFYKERFAPVVESMEGAALHYVCLSEKIPFVQIRSVSNYIAERNKKNWNMKESIVNLNKELGKLLDLVAGF
jgi:futalosine hydrolase